MGLPVSEATEERRDARTLVSATLDERTLKKAIRKSERESPGRYVLAVVLLVGLFLLVLPPMWVLVSTSIHSWNGFIRGELSLENYAAIFAADATYVIIWDSIVFALGSSILALLLGSGLAWLTERSNAPFRGVVFIAIFVSFAIPGIVQTIGWVLLLGPNAGVINTLAQQLPWINGPIFNIFSMQGMILVDGIGWAPVVFLLMVPAFQSMDPSLEEAALVSGAGSMRAFRTITFNLARPSVLAALLLSVIRSLESFETPAVLGIPAGIRVLTTEIYRQMRSGGIAPTYGRASAYAVMMFALVLVLLAVYTRATRASRKFATITGKGFRPHRTDLGRLRWLGGVACLALPVVTILPIFLLFWASFLPFYSTPSMEAFGNVSLDNYRHALSHPIIFRSMFNTVRVGLITATVAVVFTFLIAWVVVRTKVRGRGTLDQIAIFPFVIPGIVAGVAVSRTYANVDLPIYGTFLIIVIAYLLLGLPYGMRFAHAGLVKVHAELEESAAVSGASLGRLMLTILAPLMMPALFAGWIYVFLFSVRHLSSAVLLAGPGNEMLAVTILELWENGQITVLGALSMIIIAFAVGIAAIFFAISKRYGIRQ